MPSWLRLRQICLAAEKLAPVVADLEAIFGLEVGHVDPGVSVFGLENALLPVGDQFLEVVAPVRDGTAVHRYRARRGGDTGYMVITQCGDHAPRRRRVEALGIGIAFEISRPEFECMQLHPRDTGGALFEIDWQRGGERPDGPWWPAGKDWARAVHRDVVHAIAAAELQSDDPERLAARWSEITEIPLERDAEGHPTLPLENATLRFVVARDGRGEGLAALDVATVDRSRVLAVAKQRDRLVGDDTVLVCGTRFRLVS